MKDAICRGNSSNASFLRSAALGKRCILHIEYFIESAGVIMQRAKTGASGFCYRASEVFGGIQITEELRNQSAHQNVFGAS